MLFTIALLLIFPGAVADPTLDDLVSRLVAERKAATDAAKLAAATEAEILARFTAMRDTLIRLGVIGPGPDPKPPEPKPVDTLAVKLKAAYDADTGPEKKADALQLAALYREAAKLAGRADVPSSRELLGRVKAAASTLIGPEDLVSLRTIVSSELAAVFGAPSDVALTDALRTSAAALFTKLATILEGF